MIVNVGWPRAATYGPLWQHRFAPLILTVVLVGVGALVHAALDKRATVPDCHFCVDRND
jgi:hypothetical protein